MIDRAETRDVPAAITAALQLALGVPVSHAEALDWDLTLHLAVRERCAALGWSRSGAVIRAHAPVDVSGRWRAHVVTCQAHAARQLAATSTVCEVLEGVGAAPVILKGLALSEQLYGDYALREAADIDVLVPRAARAASATALTRAGWRVIEGKPPWTETYVLSNGGRELYLELHSSLFDVNLHHLVPPHPASSRLRIDGHELPVFDGPLLAGYLATHAAKHMPAPLLCFVDVLTLWDRGDAGQREAAWAAACAAGVGGYLSWMNARSEDVSRVVAGDRQRLAGLGVHGTGRRQEHAIFRDLRLARSPLAAAQALGAWLVPPPLRDDLPALAQRWLHRIRSPWTAYAIHRQEYGAAAGSARAETSPRGARR